MINLSVRDLLQQLYELDEQERIEAKTCSEVGKSVMETVCAFANEPGLDGGYLLLGIAPAPDLPEQPQEQSNNIDDLEGAPRLYPESDVLYPLPETLYPESDALYPQLQEMPQNLRDDVLQLSQRTSPERLRDLIIRLCRHRDWQAEELSHLLNRDKSYLVKFYLRPLRQAGTLKYAQQAYSAVRSEES